MGVLAQQDQGGWLERLIFRNTGGSTFTHAADHAFMVIFWLSVFWFVFLMALTAYFVWKYRRRPGRPAPASPSHNTALEIFWTVVPSATLVWMFLVGFRGYADAVVPKSNALELSLSAMKWRWSITYPGGVTTGEATAPNSFLATAVPIFYVPSEQPVKLRMSSQDVMHSFWVPDFRVKFDVFPNRYTTYWFQTLPLKADARRLSFPDPSDKQHYLDGVPYEDHWVFCAEYCGEQHSEMGAIIRAVPSDVYVKWLEANGDGSLPPAELGAKIYRNNCASCHSVDGTANTGPTWKNLYGERQKLADGSEITADDNYIRESILVPAAKIVAGFPNQMTSFQGVLNEKQIDGVIAYMKSLSVHAQQEGTPPADAKAEQEKGQEKRTDEGVTPGTH